MNIYCIFQIFIFNFKELFTYEEFMIIMKINKKFRSLTINNNFIFYTLKYKGFELNKIKDYYKILKWLFFNQKINDKHLDNIEQIIFTMPSPHNVIKSCDLLYSHFYICNNLNKYENTIKNHISFNNIIYYNDIEVIKWIVKKGFKIDVDICYYASLYNNYDILKWAVEEQNLTGKVSFDTIIHYAKLEVLQWCINKGFVIDIDICYYASIYNRYDILKWIIEEQNLIGNVSFIDIIFHDNLDMLKLCIDKGCVVDVDIYYYASKYNSHNILKWIVEKQNLINSVSLKDINLYDNLDTPIK